jgi:hypothetical protein
VRMCEGAIGEKARCGQSPVRRFAHSPFRNIRLRWGTYLLCSGLPINYGHE